MPPREPRPDALRNPLLRYLLATRPAFLSVTLCAWLVGLGAAHYSGVVLEPVRAALTLLFALVAHAGVNVLNDYYDARIGTDAINFERIFPFTGGSRFIQNGVLSLAQTGRFGATLFGAVAGAGLWLIALSGSGLFWIGLGGLAIGWAYSAPPLKLNSRGLGELCVATGFALIVVGSDYVQRAEFDSLPWIAAMPYALLVMNLLYINQFPDREADRRAGKWHLVVRLGPARARWGYAAVAATAYFWLMIAVFAGPLPGWSLVALLTAIASALAARELWRYAAQPARLAGGIKLTIAAALAHGLLLSAALLSV
jgi:1,4-dihydroxy-2-naphthoate octaprenyltransferase